MSSEVRFRIVKTRGGYDGTISLPFTPAARAELPAGPGGEPPSHVAVTAKGKTKSKAVKSAAKGALKLLKNPAVQAAMPPQVQVAMKIAEKLPLKKLKKLKFW